MLNILMNRLKDVENTILFFIFINVSEIWYKDIYLEISSVIKATKIVMICEIRLIAVISGEALIVRWQCTLLEVYLF